MIPYKAFGNTGHLSSRTIFGAFALSSISQKEADSVLNLLLKYNINHIDTAPSYGDSELRIGPWMKEHRDSFFLATKTEKRTYREAKDELYKSLDRLKVDQVDLWQMHNLVNVEQWETAMNTGGALEALVEAKEEGLVRFLGVTGHGLAAPTMHLKSLNKYAFDSVLLPYNYSLMQQLDYANAFKELLGVCKSKNVAVQTIKAIAKGKCENEKATHNVWYNPLVDLNDIKLSVNWVLANNQVFLNTAGDVKLLEKILNIANGLDKKPTEEVMQAMVKQKGIKPLFSTDEI